MSNAVCTRFAPSPTGYLHIGALRTALFNWLYARKNGGTFILRVEDTDRERYVPDSMENILEALDWYGLTPDKGVTQDTASSSPYLQSNNTERYREHSQMLITSGKAYRCFCTKERLDAMREEQRVLKRPPHYDRTCRSLSDDESEQRAQTEPFIIRARMPEEGTVELHDIVYGDIRVDWFSVDDHVLLKSDGFPTYHLANVVDDHVMSITHVIRGEEWLPSLPKHVFLYQAFGWDLPTFVHLPLVFGPDKQKLSKRHSALPALDYRGLGYLPDAVLNYIALLGWNSKTDKEIFSRDELIQAFSLEQINTSNPVFDAKKLDWFNGKHIRAMTPAKIREAAASFLNTSGIDQQGNAWIEKALPLIHGRLERLSDISDRLAFLVDLPDHEIDLLIPKKGSREATETALTSVIDAWSATDTWDEDALEKTIEDLLVKQNVTRGTVLWPARIALSGMAQSPGVYEIAAFLGKDASLKRLHDARDRLHKSG